MTTYTWATLRAHATQTFAGQTPGPELEQRIIDIFRNHPQIVAAAIDYIAERFRTGTIRSPWAVLATHLEQAITTQDIQATDTTDRAKAMRNAEQWIRTAGLHLDRASELEDELFGDLGRLRAWHNDQDLRQRMLTLWQQHRPAGEHVEQDNHDRAEHWNQTTGHQWRLERDPACRHEWVDAQQTEEVA